MPSRLELRIGEVTCVAGTPVTLAFTQGKVAAIVVAEYDDDGTVDKPSSLLTAAAMWRRRLDKRSDIA